MGIPREVAHNNQHANFLWTSANPLGPGDYQPNQSNLPKAPAASFGKLSSPGNYKSYTTQWEETMEKYIGVKPSEQGRKPSPKKEMVSQVSAMQSFEEQMRNKPSFMF